MKPSRPHSSTYSHLIRQALAEDMPFGDITTSCIMDPDAQGRAVILAKEDCVVAGLFVAQEVFAHVDDRVVCNIMFDEGAAVHTGEILMEIEGSLASILMGERVALNLIQRLCGIATLTAAFVTALTGTNCRVLDTRKTTPGLRVLEKYAVRVGGGHNHRFSLSDGILIKDNHIAACGSITEAVRRVYENAPHTIAVQCEVSNIKELQEALNAGVNAVLLDNMDTDALKKAVEFIRKTAPNVLIEASGGVTINNVREIALTGVDMVSTGSITHSVKAVDISLRILR
ncbi:MAG: carboxylating nicotinate-nucleotide diphosphorylase [Dissulfuribacterales bacterium]